MATVAKVDRPQQGMQLVLVAALLSPPAVAGPPQWLKDRFGLKVPQADSSDCQSKLLESTVASVLLAVEIQRPVALLVGALAEKKGSMYVGVPADPVSRAAARQRYEAFELEGAEGVLALGPKALSELARVFSDPSQALPLRRAALRLLLISPGAVSELPSLVNAGNRLFDLVVHGNSSSSERLLASDLVRELGAFRRWDPTVRGFLDAKLRQVLSGYVDQNTQQKVYSDQLRSELLYAWLQRADLSEYERLAVHLADPVVQGHMLVQAMVSIANTFDRLLEDAALQARITQSLISVFRPALLKALFHLQVRYPLGLESRALPEELAWNEDLGSLLGLLHLGGDLQRVDALHPAQFFQALANHSGRTPLTPAQRYLVRNFCQATIVGRVPEASFLGVEQSLVAVLENLTRVVEDLPPVRSELEARTPLEYSDLHFLLIALPWSLFSDAQKQAMVGRFQSGAKYGWGIASTAERILEKSGTADK